MPNLARDVFHGPAELLARFLVRSKRRQTEIPDDDTTLLVEEKVCRLQVTVDDSATVYVLKTEQLTKRKKPDHSKTEMMTRTS